MADRPANDVTEETAEAVGENPTFQPPPELVQPDPALIAGIDLPEPHGLGVAAGLPPPPPVAAGMSDSTGPDSLVAPAVDGSDAASQDAPSDPGTPSDWSHLLPPDDLSQRDTTQGGPAHGLPDPGAEPDPEDHRYVGQTIDGKYRIVSLIAKGAHGLVFKAVQDPIGREVAVKVLRPTLGDERMEEFRERFLREARLAGRLQHPNIVTIHDFGSFGDDSCYIVLELLRGRTLQDVLAQGPLPMERALPIFIQLCYALMHAHKSGVVHRDIKPSNIFVTTLDHSDFVKLFDFGLVMHETPKDEITDAGTFMGTPHYAAPEQIRGEVCDARIDIYSMGVLMYRTLSGRLPFRGANWVSVVLQHLQEPYPPIATANPDARVWPELEAIVERCLSKDAGARFEDTNALLNVLESFARTLGRSQVHAFDPEPTHDDGTLDTGAVAPLDEPLTAPPKTSHFGAQVSGPHPALFAAICLVLGIATFSCFAVQPWQGLGIASVDTPKVELIHVPPPSTGTPSTGTPAPEAAASTRALVAPPTPPAPVPEEPIPAEVPVEARPLVENMPVAVAVPKSDPPAPRKSTASKRTQDTEVEPAVVEAAVLTPKPTREAPAPPKVQVSATEFSGVWRGKARGWPIAFDLKVASDGAVKGTMAMRVAGVNQNRAVTGTLKVVSPGVGTLEIIDPGETEVTTYRGAIANGLVSGQVSWGGKERGKWSAAAPR